MGGGLTPGLGSAKPHSSNSRPRQTAAISSTGKPETGTPSSFRTIRYDLVFETSALILDDDAKQVVGASPMLHS